MLFFFLQYTLWLGHNGIFEYQRVFNNISLQQIDNDKLKTKNDFFISEIKDLSENLEAIEEFARHELEMIKSGEIFYRLSKH